MNHQQFAESLSLDSQMIHLERKGESCLLVRLDPKSVWWMFTPGNTYKNVTKLAMYGANEDSIEPITAMVNYPRLGDLNTASHVYRQALDLAKFAE